MLKKSILTLAISAVTLSVQAADKTPSLEEMWQLIQQQQAEISQLKSQLIKTEVKLEQTEVKVIATADAVEQGAVVGGKLAKMAEWAEKTTIGGYGEHHFNHNRDGDDQIDAHRIVTFIGHQFSDDVRFFSEIEIEHGFSGPDNANGEVEVEQAYIEWDFAKNHSAVLGQFLVPVGVLNETHEPDTFYGTERNQVEKNIVPATWWETGAMVKGEVAPGLSYNLAVHSGLAINVDNSDAGDVEYKIRDGRQKASKAIAEDLAYTARLKYTGIQGLELAATVQYQEDITQGIGMDDNSALLTELHAIYSSSGITVRALWAEWNIDGECFESGACPDAAGKSGADEQSGWYVEPSYKITDKLGAFVRYSEWNNRAGDSSTDANKVWDYGINYWLTPNVVLKADYSNNTDKDGDDNDSLNLGVGWSF
jgi:hypothetical protein